MTPPTDLKEVVDSEVKYVLPSYLVSSIRHSS